MHPNNPAALKNGSFVSSREMWNFINELGISKVDVRLMTTADLKLVNIDVSS